MRQPKQKVTTVRFTDTTQRQIEDLKSHLSASQPDILERAVDALWQDEIAVKPAVLRWLDILSLPGHRGEVDWTEVDCTECGEPIDRPHYALMSDGRLLPGPRCSGCAMEKEVTDTKI